MFRLYTGHYRASHLASCAPYITDPAVGEEYSLLQGQETMMMMMIMMMIMMMMMIMIMMIMMMMMMMMMLMMMLMMLMMIRWIAL